MAGLLGFRGSRFWFLLGGFLVLVGWLLCFR